MKSNKILVVEIGERVIKICQVTATAVKRTIDFLEVQEFPQEMTLRETENILRKFSKTKYTKVIISLPRTFFLIRFLHLPSHDAKEIQEMLPFQLAKNIPYPLEEVVYDFSLIEAKKNISKVLVFLIQGKSIGPIAESIQKAKIIPSLITLSSEGLHNWLIFQEGIFFEKERQHFIALVDIDTHYADFLVVDKEKIVFSRSFSYFNDETLLEGINQSLGIFEKEFGKVNFDKVIFTGQRKDEVLTRVDLGKVIFINDCEKFSFEKGVKEDIERKKFSTASILGLSMQKDLSKMLDFSPQSLKNIREERKSKRKYLEILFVGIEILFIAGIFLFYYVMDRYSYSKFLNAKLKEVKEEVKGLDVVADKLKILGRETKDKISFSEILYTVISSVLHNAQLTILDFQDNGDFFLKGYADDISKVFEVENLLKQSSFFNEISIKYASKVKRNKKVIVEFYIYGKQNAR